MYCYDQPDISKTCEDIMIATSRQDLSMSETWSSRIQDETGLHKLNSRWEGPFIITKVTRPGPYRLIYAEGLEIPNSWNIEHLRKFYPKLLEDNLQDFYSQ